MLKKTRRARTTKIGTMQGANVFLIYTLDRFQFEMSSSLPHEKCKRLMILLNARPSPIWDGINEPYSPQSLTPVHPRNPPTKPRFHPFHCLSAASITCSQ